MKKILLLFMLLPTISKSQESIYKDSVYFKDFLVDDIKAVFSYDSCGGGGRDVLAEYFVRTKLLLGLQENDILFLLGKPHRISNGEQKVYLYSLVQGYNKYTKKCEYLTYKALEIYIDPKNKYVYFMRIKEE